MTVHLQSRVPGAARAFVRSVGDRSVVWVDVSGDVHKGALSKEASSIIEAGARTAVAEGVPMVTVIASSGADIREGISALHGWGLAARALTDCSGKVPTIMVVDGPAVSGPALLLGIVDHVVMTESSYAFVSGPTMVAEFTGITIDNDELGGAAAHARHTGAASVVVSDLESAVVASHRIQHALRPAVLDAGLVAALEWLARGFRERSGLAVEFQSNREDFEIAPDRAAALYRVAHEALTNVRKHAREAGRVQVQLFAMADEVTLEVSDDGPGFDTATLGAGPGFGVRGMIERARGLGGWAEVSSSAGRGTTVMFSIPPVPPAGGVATGEGGQG